MPKRLPVTDTTLANDCLLVTLAETLPTDNLHATGRMLVDSDDLAFIYIVDSNEGYFYIAFTKSTWSVLKDVLSEQYNVFLVIEGEKKLELEGFREEMAFLVDNISGNPNYGEHMSTEVERIFNEK